MLLKRTGTGTEAESHAIAQALHSVMLEHFLNGGLATPDME